jgi:TrmH family RNA methyltransferase
MAKWSRSLAKEISRLQQKKFRQSNLQFVVEGPKLVEEALQQNRFPVKSVIGTQNHLDRMSSNTKNIVFYSVPTTEIKKISSLRNPQDILAVLSMPSEQIMPTGSFLIYLDNLQNPGNLGTIFRSAEWFGVSGILIGEGTVDPFNPKVVQSSMGSLLRMPFSFCSHDELDQLSKKYELVAADMTGTSIEEFTPPLPTILIIGNEGSGLSPNLRNKRIQSVSIPQHPQGKAESLNAALSASVIMYSWQQKK